MPKKAKKRTAQNEISAKVLAKTFFVPMTRMNEVLDLIEGPFVRWKQRTRCDYTLMSLKHERSTRECYDERAERYSSTRHIALFVSACYKALYAQDWDRLLYIVRGIPKWKLVKMMTFHARVLTVLLMYHPDSQANGFLNEYMHMVWGCRTDQDKKAILKVLLTLNKKMHNSSYTKKYWLDVYEQKRKAFLAARDGNKSETNENVPAE